MLLRLVLILMVVLNPIAGRYYCRVHQHTITLFGMCIPVCNPWCAGHLSGHGHECHLKNHEHGCLLRLDDEHGCWEGCHDVQEQLEDPCETVLHASCCQVEQQQTLVMCVNPKEVPLEDVAVLSVTQNDRNETSKDRLLRRGRFSDESPGALRLHLFFCVMLV